MDGIEPTDKMSKEPESIREQIPKLELPSDPEESSQEDCQSSPCYSSTNKTDGGTLTPDGFRSVSPRPASAGEKSPRTPQITPRGALGWRPVMPGYGPPQKGISGTSTLVIRSSLEVEHHSRSGSDVDDRNLRTSIPVMRRPLAIVCFGLNIVIPGSGTLLAGLSVLCCSTPRPKGADPWQCLWMNAFCAFLQILTSLILVGWVWSIAWGAAFVARAGQIDEADDSPEGSDSRPVTSVSGRVATRTSATTTLQVPRIDTPGNQRSPEAPIIVLQQAPLIIQPEPSDPHPPDPPIRPSRRHQRLMRRQATEESVLPSYLLRTDALESIVIGSAPVPDAMVFGYPENSDCAHVGLPKT